MPVARMGALWAEKKDGLLAEWTVAKRDGKKAATAGSSAECSAACWAEWKAEKSGARHQAS